MSLSRTELDHLRQVPEDRILQETLTRLRGRVAVVSSFGAESAVLLDLVAQIDPSVPVFFLDTKRHFPETLEYRDLLVRNLGLSDVRTLSPTPKALHDRDPQDQLAAFDPDACCVLRKVEPLDLVLPEFDVWITGRKRSQSATRTALPVLDPQPDGSVKLNPLAGWGPAQIEAQMQRRDLPRHPLVAKGYTSIGCAPCTRAVKDGEDGRAGRWAGLAKTECGIHRPA
ncbi:phosphoadenylyl-sulfate reductase [Gluconobacter sp. Dm-73]|uniref:phosphoadenylyl-sulfate reductase n=1 Tax=Gluconobacter sp. Dm-73 TaxID=2799802 RepID=UPI001B8C04DF|nr:phosphoadenylyl-sulfate reductase [Gluconobacter sp. Dm-73]MBS1076041.1 phosphoadenylyl-sulfate reductase [Gluconobacter sp. Dm-73]